MVSKIEYFYCLSFSLFVYFGYVTTNDFVNEEDWKGNWFPKSPNSQNDEINNLAFDLNSNDPEIENDSWKGNWFPHIPGGKDTNLISNKTKTKEICDDGNTNLEIDFDSKNIFHSLYYKCNENRILYISNYSVEPEMIKYEVPSGYLALKKCMNEKISYDLRLPTFGSYRKIWPKYGEYNYVPPQRWITSLNHGGIVALYHPCANKQQIEKFKNVVRNCLFRHVISASNQLLSQKPFAVIAYGHSLEMSVVENSLVVNFIKRFALKGTQNNADDGLYDMELIKNADIISNKMDDKLCPNNSI